MNVPRRCCRPACPHYAVATLTFVYSDSTAVVGPLATAAEPHSWDLCFSHAGRITAPRGWDLVRHPGPWVSPEEDDLIALAEAVREGETGRAAPANGWYPQAAPTESATRGAPATTSGGGVLAPPGPPGKNSGRRRGHLRVLPDPSD
ncbi:DUF3499 domain-containing protein [[Mycobacterium] crassicus]|uniref:DUF3499 domain-containing protein n=1 Tax=[Mycobacterium] crassicus TaxID=2872309 RepID=A0ABU5XCD7_9MYCO|nr:DUF3499 domain-containing protein [Mycolicibacter sp. MYC098]MEB3019970.1 DUF3499 domain-containing protein [Mycolicibacter sp. MYC098]